MIIYVLEDPAEPGVIRYVGKTAYTVEQRLAKHLAGGARGGRTHRHNWLRKVLSEGRIPIGRAIAFAATESEANELERYYIASFCALGMRLTNATDGGEGVVGHYHTEESKRRMSERARGKKRGPRPRYIVDKIAAVQRGKSKPQTPERIARQKEVMNRPDVRAKMSLAHLGKRHTEEQKRKIGLAISRVQTGVPKPLVQRLKISAALIGRKQSEETKRKRRESMARPDVKERMRRRPPGHRWKRGEKHAPCSDETRKKMVIARSKRGPCSDIQRRRTSESLRRYHQARRSAQIEMDLGVN